MENIEKETKKDELIDMEIIQDFQRRIINALSKSLMILIICEFGMLAFYTLIGWFTMPIVMIIFTTIIIGLFGLSALSNLFIQSIEKMIEEQKEKNLEI